MHTMTGNDPGKPFGPDGLNDELWDRLRQIISSANRGDADAHALAILRWPEEVSLAGQQHAGAYLLYLMYRKVKLTLGRAPTPDDLRELTVSAYPRFREILRADEVQLEDTFRRAFELPLLGARLTPGEFFVFSSVALGTLLVSPADELDAMRPGLASWLHLNRDKFRAEGLLDDLPGEQGP